MHAKTGNEIEDGSAYRRRKARAVDFVDGGNAMNDAMGATAARRSASRNYNAAQDLIERNLAAGRGEKTAYIDDAGRYSYDELARRVDAAGRALTGLGIARE